MDEQPTNLTIDPGVSLWHPSLPEKYASTYIAGKPVGREVAARIIIQGLNPWNFFSNDREWQKEAQEIMGAPEEPNHHGRGASNEEIRKYFNALTKWQERTRNLQLSNLDTNDSLFDDAHYSTSSSWVHPDGKIIGSAASSKWYSTETIAKEFAQLAEAFPELDLIGVHIPDGDQPPPFMYRVNGGQVIIAAYDEKVWEEYVRQSGWTEESPEQLEYRRRMEEGSGYIDEYIAEWKKSGYAMGMKQWTYHLVDADFLRYAMTLFPEQ